MTENTPLKKFQDLIKIVMSVHVNLVHDSVGKGVSFHSLVVFRVGSAIVRRYCGHSQWSKQNVMVVLDVLDRARVWNTHCPVDVTEVNVSIDNQSYCSNNLNRGRKSKSA